MKNRPNWTREQPGRWVYRPGGVFVRARVRWDLRHQLYKASDVHRNAWFERLIDAQVMCELAWRYDPGADARWTQEVGGPEAAKAIMDNVVREVDHG